MAFIPTFPLLEEKKNKYKQLGEWVRKWVSGMRTIRLKRRVGSVECVVYPTLAAAQAAAPTQRWPDAYFGVWEVTDGWVWVDDDAHPLLEGRLASEHKDGRWTQRRGKQAVPAPTGEDELDAWLKGD